MIKQEASSWQAALAIREAERIIQGNARGVHRRLAARKLVRGLYHGLLVSGFLAFCFLPTLTLLALIGLALFLSR
jgi:hypothetical protein